VTSKIDIRMIISDHFGTFRDEGTGETSKVDLVVMILFPLLVAAGAYFFGFKIRDNHVGTLISVFAIFAGLLFNVLVLIYSFSDSDLDGQKTLRDELLRQSFSNISYSIVLALFTVFVLTAVLFVGGITQRILEAAVVLIAVHFFLSLLMVLKRIHVLLRDKFGG
jgi:hypothetical protein